MPVDHLADQSLQVGDMGAHGSRGRLDRRCHLFGVAGRILRWGIQRDAELLYVGPSQHEWDALPGQPGEPGVGNSSLVCEVDVHSLRGVYGGVVG